MSKRVVSILLSILMVLSIVPFVNAEETSNYKIDWLVENNYVKGRDGGNLELEKYITRAEFTKMVLVVTGELGVAEGFDTTSRFSDVPSTHWACAIINYANQKGYVNGYVDGTFHPDEFITYEEGIAILARLNKDFVKGATDNGYWAQPYIDYALRTGILDGIVINDYKDLIVRRYAFEMVYNEIMLYQRLNQPVEEKPAEDTSKKETEKTQESRPTPRPRHFYDWDRWDNDNGYYPPTPPTPPTPEPGPTCPTETEVKDAFAEAVGTAVNGITIPETIATKEYNAKDRKATVTIVNGEEVFKSLKGTNAMVELKKLIDEKGLISYQIEGQPERTLEGKNPTDDDAEIKGWIAQDFGKVLGVDENFTLAKLNGKTVKATVKFKSTDANCPLETSDEYSVTFVTADAPTCPTETEVKDAFAEAVGTAVNGITIPETIATKEYNAKDRKATVTIVNGEEVFKSLKGTNAMVELKKLIDEKGLISYQIEGQPERTLEGKNPTDDDAEIKGWIAQDFGKVLGVDENFTLAKLNGKTVKATVKFKSTDANCPLETSDEYSVTFVTADAPAEEVKAKILEKNFSLGQSSIRIELTEAIYKDIAEITVDGEKPKFVKANGNDESSNIFALSVEKKLEDIGTIIIKLKNDELIELKVN